MHGNAKILRRTMVWMLVAVFAIGGALFFEHDSSAKGVLLDSPTLVKNDGTCEQDHQGPDTKPNCVPCPESTKKSGEAKKCKPCKTDENGDPQIDPHNGNHKPKHCVFSGEEFGQHEH